MPPPDIAPLHCAHVQLRFSCMHTPPGLLSTRPPIHAHTHGALPPHVAEVTRADATADVMHPHGHALTPHNRTSLQQHYDYFDL